MNALSSHFSPPATKSPAPVPRYPLVSCLCVTRFKPEKLQRAVDCFLAQRYPNKELVLVYEDDDLATQALADSLAREHGDLILVVRVSANPKLKLGDLRNISIDQARGEYFCQWDDDDWYHNERIGRQLEAAQANHRDACLLTNWIIFDEVERQAYFSFVRLWEGSVLCKSDVLSSTLRYPAAAKFEDTVFTRLLVARGSVFPLVAASLYIYTAHGTNTWSREHFRTMFSLSQKLDVETTALIADILAGKYSVDEASAILSTETMLRKLIYFYEPPKDP